MAVAQALMTALLSGLFSGFVLFGLNERRDRSDFLLRKIEETIEAYNAFLLTAQEFVWVYWDFAPKGSYEAASIKRDTLKKDLDKATSKARTLMKIYTPDQMHLFNRVAKILGVFAEPSAKIIHASLNDQGYDAARYEVIPTTSMALVDVGKATDSLYDEARAIAHRPFILRAYRPWPFAPRRSKVTPRTPAPLHQDRTHADRTPVAASDVPAGEARAAKHQGPGRAG